MQRRVLFALPASILLLVALAPQTSARPIQESPKQAAPWDAEGLSFESWRWRRIDGPALSADERAELDRWRAGLDQVRAAARAGRRSEAQDAAIGTLRSLLESGVLEGRVERALLIRPLAGHVVERDPSLGKQVMLECVAALERERPEGDFELLRSQEMLALAEILGGEADAGLARLERILRIAERVLAPNDGELARLRTRLATELDYADVDMERSMALLSAAQDEAEASMAQDDSSLIRLLERQGKIALAIERAERAVATLERTRGPQSIELARARENLARCLSNAGAYERAESLYAAALKTWQTNSSGSHTEIRNVQLNVARELENLERFVEARGLLEQVLAQLERTAPVDHRSIAQVQARLATVLLHTHDVERATVLAEAAWQHCEKRGLGYDDTVRRSAAQAMDRALAQQGRLDEAIALLRQQLEYYESTREDADGTLRWIRLRLAIRYKQANRLAEALALEDRVLPVLEASLGHDHTDTLNARNNRARTWMRMGRLEEAGAEWDALYAKLLDRKDTDLLRSIRANRVQLAYALGATLALRDSTLEMLDAAFEECAAHPALSRRESAEWAGNVGFESGLACALSDSQAPDAVIAERLFGLIETSKSLQRSGYRASAPVEADPELNELRRDAQQARERVAVASAMRASSEELERIARARDRAERRYAERSLELGASRVLIEARAVREALRTDQAVVAYAVLDQFDAEDLTAPATPMLVAHVLRNEGPPRRILLGEVADRHSEVEVLRSAAGVPLDATVAERENEQERERAAALVRERLVDPVLAACGDAKELIVALDGPVSLVPIDAFEGAGGLLGETRRIRFVSSFAELVAPAERRSGTSTALVIGGVDYGPLPVEQAPVEASAQVASLTPRREQTHAFKPLGASAKEAQAAGAALLRGFQSSVEHLTGADATRARFLSAIERARFLHAATHAWSAPDSEASAEFAPLSLVGLAFAGANEACQRGTPNEAVVVAEELAGLDLRGLELAVLSACGTHAGVLTDGQGVQSLQAALHAAGVRWTVASLWPVDDAATRELMAAFYRELTRRGEPLDPAAALWAARMERRDAGESYRSWAGWMATGVAR